ncbi:MAG: sugar-binding domain-containing protein [Gemmataceae bacterium]
MYPHRIRLRGPWDCEPLAGEAGTAPAARTVTMPCTWSEAGLEGFAGKALFRRRFGAPRQLDAGERVWLTFEGLSQHAEVWLNEELLGQHRGAGPVEFEITKRIDDRNELVVEVENGADEGGLWGEVAVEIRCDAFLRDVNFRTVAAQGKTAILHAEGLVVGQSDRPLEVRLFMDNNQVAEEEVAPSVTGTQFHLEVGGLRVQRAKPGVEQTSHFYRVRLDLRHDMAVWYVHEDIVEFFEEPA